MDILYHVITVNHSITQC